MTTSVFGTDTQARIQPLLLAGSKSVSHVHGDVAGDELHLACPANSSPALGIDLDSDILGKLQNGFM
jgi:hypothetical protein